MFSKAFLSCSNLSSAESSVLPPLTMSSPFFCLRPKGVGRVREKVYPISGLNNVYIIYFLWMSTLFFFFSNTTLDKAVLAFRGMGKSQFHSAYKSQHSWTCNLQLPYFCKQQVPRTISQKGYLCPRGIVASKTWLQ